MAFKENLITRDAPKILKNYDLGDFTITIIEEHLSENNSRNVTEPVHSFYLSCCGYAKRIFSILESAASEEMYKELIELNIETEIAIFKEETADLEFKFHVLNP